MRRGLEHESVSCVFRHLGSGEAGSTGCDGGLAGHGGIRVIYVWICA